MEPDPLSARYPFFTAAREAVAAADESLPELAAAGAPAVERGRERVERALLEGTVASEGSNDPRTELLSYPIARILVSLLDSEPAVEKYAAAEAVTAAERFRADLDREPARSHSAPSLSLDDLLREFDLAADVRPAPGRRDASRLAVGRYLELADPDWGDDWRLVARELDAGADAVARAELHRLLRAAVRRRVREGLPFELAGEAIADAVEPQVADLRRLLSERARVGEFDRVVPELFPPCMRNLRTKAAEGVRLRPIESFALMAFLTGIGMTADEIVAFCAGSSLSAERIRYQTEYLRDDRGTQYPPPTCETLSNYGICHNEDDHMRVAADPLGYYDRRLDAADDGTLTDWRAARDGGAGGGTDGAEAEAEAGAGPETGTGTGPGTGDAGS
jgi:DNA primase large subunit